LCLLLLPPPLLLLVVVALLLLLVLCSEGTQQRPHLLGVQSEGCGPMCCCQHIQLLADGCVCWAAVQLQVFGGT
jgi:hypothetical protein